MNQFLDFQWVVVNFKLPRPTMLESLSSACLSSSGSLITLRRSTVISAMHAMWMEQEKGYFVFFGMVAW